MFFSGLIDTLGSYLTKTFNYYRKDPQPGGDPPQSGADASSVVECLSQLLSLLKSMLDRVTMFVKQALQVSCL